MKVRDLETVKLFSRNGHVLFVGKASEIPEMFKDFEVMRYTDGGAIMLHAWASTTYDEGKKLITIKGE